MDEIRPIDDPLFKSEFREGMRVDWDVPIEMDDGLVLRANVYRPDDDGQYPVIMSHGPYGKDLHFEELYQTCWDLMCQNHPDVPAGSSNIHQSWEVCDPEKWVPKGYVIVRVDSRGAGRSPGYLEHWSPRENQDFAACIEWAGGQPWSNGKVGLSGISYYAVNQWQVAALQPKHLAAICPWEGFADFYGNWPITAVFIRRSCATGTTSRSWRSSMAMANGGSGHAPMANGRRVPRAVPTTN